jgi:hypothetical protein
MVVILILFGISIGLMYLSFHYTADQLDKIFIDSLINMFGWLQDHGLKVVSVIVFIVACLCLYAWFEERRKKPPKVLIDALKDRQ